MLNQYEAFLLVKKGTAHAQAVLSIFSVHSAWQSSLPYLYCVYYVYKNMFMCIAACIMFSLVCLVSAVSQQLIKGPSKCFLLLLCAGVLEVRVSGDNPDTIVEWPHPQSEVEVGLRLLDLTTACSVFPILFLLSYPRSFAHSLIFSLNVPSFTHSLFLLTLLLFPNSLISSLLSPSSMLYVRVVCVAETFYCILRPME